MVAWQINTFAELSSTQDYLRDLAEAAASEGTVVQALSQTAGRGRQGRIWTSPLGNLYMSALLRPSCSAEMAGQMSFVTGLAVSAGIDEFLAPGVTKKLKWPNDVLIDGQKAAGVLIESLLGAGGLVEALIIGIGVNVLAAPEGAVGLTAVSDGQPVPIHPLRDRILEQLARFYAQWQSDGFAPIRDLWLAQAHALDQKITARFSRDAVEGTFRGLDARGALLLETAPGRTRTIAAAEIIA